MFLVSLWTGSIDAGYSQTWNFGIYPEALGEYWPWLIRSIVYGGLATILAFALGFPLAYFIAFRGGAYKNLLLFLVIAPFFTSFLLRTISWKIILADNGTAPRTDQGCRAAARVDSGVLATPTAVIAGITYNFLPFMTLPLYVALEKIDKRLLEAAAGPVRRPVATAGHDRRAASSAARSVSSSVPVMDYGPLALGIPGAIVGGARGYVPDQPGLHPGHAARWRCPASSPARC